MAVGHHRRRLLPRAPPAWHGRANGLAGGPLTERGREVLRHVSCLLSNAEVAIEMSITIHTVKAHLKSIYRKLAATRRGEAVRRARQLGLI
jgi:LuxR family transcriptional regulator, maltose regulon positive regulatory protein